MYQQYGLSISTEYTKTWVSKKWEKTKKKLHIITLKHTLFSFQSAFFSSFFVCHHPDNLAWKFEKLFSFFLIRFSPLSTIVYKKKKKKKNFLSFFISFYFYFSFNSFFENINSDTGPRTFVGSCRQRQRIPSPMGYIRRPRKGPTIRLRKVNPNTFQYNNTNNIFICIYVCMINKKKIFFQDRT